jgi:hypothetical protein
MPYRVGSNRDAFWPASSSRFVAGHGMQLSAQCRQVGEVLFALRDASHVARLVLAADQAVRRSAAQRLRIYVGAGAANLVLDMGPDLLGRSQRPALAGTVREKLR